MLGTFSRKKAAVLLDFVQITSPQFGQLFSDVEIQDLKVNWGLKIPYILYKQPKHNLKSKSLAFLNRKNPLIDQKCTSSKGAKNSGTDPPKKGQWLKENIVIPRKSFLIGLNTALKKMKTCFSVDNFWFKRNKDFLHFSCHDLYQLKSIKSVWSRTVRTNIYNAYIKDYTRIRQKIQRLKVYRHFFKFWTFY